LICQSADLEIYYENSSFFWTLSGAMKPSPSMGFRFRVSGVRPALTFSLLTPETLVPMSNFHAIPQQLGCHSHLSKLNDDIWSVAEITKINKIEIQLFLSNLHD